MTIRGVCPRAVMALASAATFVLATVGCSGDDGADDLPATPPPLQTTGAGQAAVELTAEEQAAVDEVREVFDLFLTAYIDVATSGETPDLDVHFRYTQYGGGRITTDAVNEIGDNFLEDRVAEGTIEWEFVEVVDLDLDRVFRDRESPQLRLRYCLDFTNWVSVDKNTGERVGEPGGRHMSIIMGGVQESWDDDGKEGWRVIEREDEEDQPC